MYSLIYSHEFNKAFEEKNEESFFNEKVTWLDRFVMRLFK